MKVYLPIFSKSEDKNYLSIVNEQKDLKFLQNRLNPDIELAIGAELPSSRDYEVLVTGRPTREYLAASRQLHTLIIPFAGLPEATRDLLFDFPKLRVHNLHFNADETAEMAISLLMTAAKYHIPIDKAFREHNWGQRYENLSASILLSGKKALVIGYGAIGQRIAKICQALGMNVQALRRTPEGPVASTEEIKVSTISELSIHLPTSNVVIIALPLTPDTERLFGPEQLGLLPKDAILVNIGRGKIVDEEALYLSLKSGKIRAGLDVWYNYPKDDASMTSTPPSKFPFHELDNVVMSPHRGGHSQEMSERRMAALAEMLNLAATGKALPNAIDVSRGY